MKHSSLQDNAKLQPGAKRPWPSLFATKRACHAALLILFGLLALLGACFLFYPPFGQAVRGWAMLFTQRSVHSLLGALRAAGGPGPLLSVLLVATKSLFLPHLPLLIYIACVQQYGLAAGCLLVSLGLLLACGFHFLLGRLLAGAFLPSANAVHWATDVMRRWGWCLAAAVALLLPPGWGLWLGGVAAGFMAGKAWHYFTGALAPQVLWLLAYAFFCTPYRTLLPAAPLALLRLFAALLLLLFAWQTVRQSPAYKKHWQPR